MATTFSLGGIQGVRRLGRRVGLKDALAESSTFSKIADLFVESFSPITLDLNSTISVTMRTSWALTLLQCDKPDQTWSDCSPSRPPWSGTPDAIVPCVGNSKCLIKPKDA